MQIKKLFELALIVCSTNLVISNGICSENNGNDNQNVNINNTNDEKYENPIITMYKNMKQPEHMYKLRKCDQDIDINDNDLNNIVPDIEETGMDKTNMDETDMDKTGMEETGMEETGYKHPIFKMYENMQQQGNLNNGFDDYINNSWDMNDNINSNDGN